MRPSLCSPLAKFLLIVSGVFAPLQIAFGQDMASSANQAVTQASHGRDLQLEVFINGAPTNLIGSFTQRPDGSLVATPKELIAVGLKPRGAAADGDGLVRLDDIIGISYRIDEATQRLFVTAADQARQPHIINAEPGFAEAVPEPQRSYGGVLNYTLFASSDASACCNAQAFPGLSAAFDTRVFSPYGTLSQSFTVATAPAEFGTLAMLDPRDVTRLQTTWAYSDRDRMITYRAGDMISGGLSWTRPVWLGGLQIERNFALRPDLITMPTPSLSGSAAVPSTLDLYTQGVKTFTGAIPAGPYEITNLPITTGAGTARVVVRDAVGRETTETLPFFTSNQLLKESLYDFSAELGFPRRYYGIESDNYDDRPMGSASLRYGWAEWVTLESHFEGGAGLANGGAGAVFPLGAVGVASFALAGSDAAGSTGAQVSASVQLGYRGVSLCARTQRTFGDYEDVASITANFFPSPNEPISVFAGVAPFTARPPKALDQVSLGVPLFFDASSLNLSFTEIESVLGDRDRIIGLSYSRPFFHNSTVFASAFSDFENKDSFGIFAGISLPLGRNISSSMGVESGPKGVGFAGDVSKSEQQEVGSYGWHVHDAETPFADNPVSGGLPTDRSAALSYRASFGRLEAGVQQYNNDFLATAAMDGAIAFLDGGIFFANRIDDAFAVVDVGAPNVTVQYENRPIGNTNSRGLLLVPYLNSYQNNKISIDPVNLAVDANVPTTRKTVVPEDRSGVVVKFGVEQTSQSALITFVDGGGKTLGVGAQGRLEVDGEAFVVGYDGQAYITGLAAHNLVTIKKSNGDSCRAEFSYKPRPGEQVTIKDVVCR